MSSEYSLCSQTPVYVPRVQFMSPECSLCPHGAVNLPRVQYIFSESSLCPHSTVYVPRVKFMSSGYGIFPQIEVNLIILLCISQEHRLSSKVQFMALDYTLCPNSQSIVYILRAQFSSTENSLCP